MSNQVATVFQQPSHLTPLLAKIRESRKESCLSTDLPGEALHCFADMTSVLCSTQLAMIWLPAGKNRPQFFTFGTNGISESALNFMSWFGFTDDDIETYITETEIDIDTLTSESDQVISEFNYFCKVPIVEASGTIAGVLCVADGEQRQVSEADRQILNQLASQIGRCLDLHNRLHVSERRAQQLQAAADAEKARFAEADKRLAALRLENDNLRRLSETDSLTGIKNRRAFDIALGDEIERLDRMSGVISVMMIDVDEFKQFNDSFGHIAGDEVLKVIALLLQNSVRAYDHVARFGGEEFAIIFFGTTADEACEVAARLQQSVESYPWPVRPVTISMGVASSTSREHNDSLLHRADSAMYRAKKNGRNRMERWEFPASA